MVRDSRMGRCPRTRKGSRIPGLCRELWSLERHRHRGKPEIRGKDPGQMGGPGIPERSRKRPMGAVRKTRRAQVT